MNRKRLERLIKVLQEVRRERKPFTIDSWSIMVSRFDHSIVNRRGNSCGTACCALGYATLDPSFRRQGLSLKTADGKPVTSRNIAKVEEKGAITEPVFNGYWGLSAGAAFFDISDNEAAYLFMPHTYYNLDRPVRPSDVIKRVRKLLNS